MYHFLSLSSVNRNISFPSLSQTERIHRNLCPLVWENPFSFLCQMQTDLLLTPKIFYKVGCVLPMIISSEFRLGQYRDEDHRQDPLHFKMIFQNDLTFKSNLKSNLTPVGKKFFMTTILILFAGLFHIFTAYRP